MTRVLIVDDNTQNLYMLETVLKSCGYEVISAQNGAEAIESALKNPPDLIVTDILMPKMDGFELCRRCKADERLRQIPLIFYTATYTDLKDEQFALSLGADRFVIKPQQPEALVQIIQEVLAKPLKAGQVPTPMPSKDEKEVLQRYNEVLFRKLEQKVLQLEDAIVKQKMIEDELRDSEKKYRTLITQSPDGIFIVNLKGNFLSVNRTMCESLKYTEKEFLSMNIWDIVHEQYRDLHKGRMADILSGKAHGIAAEYMVRASDGNMRSVEILSAPYYEKEELIGFQGTARDITERKKADDNLRFINAMLTTENETSLDGILVVDDQGSIVLYNQNFMDIWDIPSDVMKSRSDKQAIQSVLSKIIDPENFDKLINYLYEHKEEKSRDEIRLKGGRVLDRFSAPMFGADRHYYGRVWYFRDITERKQSDEKLEQSFQKLQKAIENTIQAIALTSETRDPYTAGHQKRVAKLAYAIAEEMVLPKEQIETVRIAGILHDIGKIKVPSEILSKPGRLSEIEMNLIKAHSQVGYDILKKLELPWNICPIVLQHHERMDGSGYPAGLSGKGIELEARILAVADVVEAMASHRPYRPALGIDKALEEIIKNKGKFYDPDVVDVCLKVFNEKNFKFD